MKYLLEYAQFRPAAHDETLSIGERQTEIIEADGYEAAEKEAALFLAEQEGRDMISLRAMHLPEPGTVVQPRPEFIPEDELYDHCSRF